VKKLAKILCWFGWHDWSPYRSGIRGLLITAASGACGAERDGIGCREMSDRGEMVVIEMVSAERLKLYGQITARMKELGYNPCDYNGLELGIDLPADWPIDMNDHPTMAQLIVLARKLKMRIVINNLDVIPLKQTDENP